MSRPQRKYPSRGDRALVTLPPQVPGGRRVRYAVGDMPFKSQAQRRKFAQLLVDGKISNQTFEEWNRETGGKQLPERVKPKKTTRKKTRVKARAKTRTKARKKTSR